MNATAKRRRMRGSAGLTLVELLIALALLGMISALALGGVRLGARTWETVTTRAEATGRIQTVRTFLGRELSQIMPLKLGAQRGNAELAFRGEPDSLIFVAPLAAHFGLGGPQRLRLFVVEADLEAGGGKELVLLRRPFVDGARFDQDDDETDEAHILLDGIAEASFSYREADDDSDAAWSGNWRDADRLPGAIRLRVSFEGGNRGDWPELIVIRRITADAECLIPVGTTRCRGG